MQTSRDKYRQAVTETLTGWRLGIIPPRPNWSREQHIVHLALTEIVALRLQDAYLPIFQTLARIEARVGVICDLREDPYAPKER